MDIKRSAVWSAVRRVCICSNGKRDYDEHLGKISTFFLWHMGYKLIALNLKNNFEKVIKERD